MPNALRVIREMREKIEEEQRNLQQQVVMASHAVRSAQEGMASNEGALLALREVERRLKTKNPAGGGPTPPPEGTIGEGEGKQ